MSTVLANPAEMIAHGAPRVIHNDAELEMYTTLFSGSLRWRALLVLKLKRSNS